MALFVVYVDANVLNLLTVGDVKDFVNFMLDRESVRIPSEHARDRMAGLVGIGRYSRFEQAKQQRITIGAFTTDGDPGYDGIDNPQSKSNLPEFDQTLDLPCTRKCPASVEKGKTSNAQNATDGGRAQLFLGVLPPVVFCDDPITKMQ
jgi:hypothetical protein